MTRMQKINEYYINKMLKLGRVRFSLILVFALFVIPFIITSSFSILFGIKEKLHILRSLSISVVASLVILYIFYPIIEQIQRSRKQLACVIKQLNQLHRRDSELKLQLQKNIEQLNQEISIRRKAESQYEDVLNTLQVEIIERKKAQTELEQQSGFLRSFIDVSPDLIYYRNEEGQFLGCNHSMELLAGKTESELIGLCPNDVYPFDMAKSISESDEKVLRYNIRLTYEQWVTYPDGQKACFEVKKIPFFNSYGKRQGFMGFGRDITERKSYQNVLEKTSQEKTTFISTISHELRTPLNGIIGLSRILLDSQLTDEQRNYLKTIYVSATTLGIIFNDIVEFDKIERRKIQIEQTAVNLIEFFANLENLASIIIEQKKLEFSLVIDESCPNYLLIDQVRLNQILWNIIHNAVKFTTKGKISVNISYMPENATLNIRVKDTGIGIAESEFDNIFTMYYQAPDKSPAYNSSAGTGIGLAISKRLANAMEGNIILESKLGEGSCFTIQINAPMVTHENMTITDILLPSLHILLVEDVELNIIVARAVLEKLGHTIDIAMTGKEAIKLFDPEVYDMVLLDIQLPDMTGIDVAKFIREKYNNQPIPPLIAFTANTLKPRQEYLDVGIDDVITKPLEISALNSIIARFWGIPNQSPQSIIQPQEQSNLILDINMLVQYIELIDADLMHKNIDVFEQIMPDYLNTLEAYLAVKDDAGIADEGHKIKGATGSLGLLRLQQLAQQIQTPTLPAWHNNVKRWIDEMKQEWRDDISVLREWITSYETKKK